MKTYGFAIVGCGMISDYHAAAIADLPQARLVAVASRTEKNRRRLMEKYGCEGAVDYRELAGRKDIDVACICTPTGAHLEASETFARAGKDLIVEKPLEVTLERADALIRVCDENRVRLCTVFPYRFTEGAIALKAAVAQGRFGRITVGDAYNKWWRAQSYYDGDAWRGTWKFDGGGACMNQGIHAVDLIQWYLGPVESLCGFADRLVRERIEVEDTAVAAVRYRNGAMGVIECTTSVYPGLSRKIEIHGDQGTVVMADELFVQWEFARERPEDQEIRTRLAFGKGLVGVGAADARAITYVNHREQIRDFLRAIESGSQPVADGREGRKSLEIVMALYRSSRQGQRVTLPLQPEA
jgi:predicted dehydrogenase